jgi:menaquinol-cytochrome c reductase iron-sulfur subunit
MNDHSSAEVRGEEPLLERRQLLGWFVKGVALTVGGIVTVPAVITAISPAIRPPREEHWAAIGPVANFQIGQVAKAAVSIPQNAGRPGPAEKSVYILRRDEHEFTVYSRTCTDLSCPLTWDPGSEWFYCPCHGGIFSMDGEPQAGPPSRPMYRYANRVRDGILEIDLNSVPVIA